MTFHTRRQRYRIVVLLLLVEGVRSFAPHKIHRLGVSRAKRQSPLVTLRVDAQRIHEKKPRISSTQRKHPPSTAEKVTRDDNAAKKSNSPTANLRAQLEFARNGHCVLRQSFPQQRISKLRKDLMNHAHRQELLAWQQKVEVAAQSPQRGKECKTIADCRKALVELGASPDEVPFLQYFNTWRELPSVLEMARDLAVTASVLLDCDSIRLYQDSLFWKRAGDGPTPWHTDGRMAPFDTSLLITFWIPLQDVPRDGSALVFCSKSHSDFALPYWNEFSKTQDDPNSPWNHLEERYGNEAALVDYMPLKVGDVTAHSGWVLHCADPVPMGADDRVALAISFVDSRAPVRLRSSAQKNQDEAGDPEDAWSYRDWIRQVPANQPNFRHEFVPILFPPSSWQNASKRVPKTRKKGM